MMPQLQLGKKNQYHSFHEPPYQYQRIELFSRCHHLLQILNCLTQKGYQNQAIEDQYQQIYLCCNKKMFQRYVYEWCGKLKNVRKKTKINDIIKPHHEHFIMKFFRRQSHIFYFFHFFLLITATVGQVYPKLSTYLFLQWHNNQKQNHTTV